MYNEKKKISRNKMKRTNSHKRKNGDDQEGDENNEKDDTRGGCMLLVSIWRRIEWMGETVYNRILSHVIRSPIFHQLFYSFFFRVQLPPERTSVAPSLIAYKNA